MKFWDSSAIVPLLVSESPTDMLEKMLNEDATVVAWWGSGVECASALARREREGADAGQTAPLAEGYLRLRSLMRDWQEVQPVDAVRELAFRLLRVHTLSAADALQLAAAIVASENRPDTLDFVCLDAGLGLAAQREGFHLVALLGL